MYENVGRFQIAVNNPEFVHFFKAFGYLPDDIEGSLLVDFAGGTEALQIPTGAKLHNQINVVACSDNIVKFDYVGVLQLLHDVDLVVQRLLQVAV